MGLFNRNKGEAPAPAAPEAGNSPADNGSFDFDAIARDLDAHNGASSFDALLAAPATNAPQTAESSAFDFPDDPLGLSTPAQNTPPATATVPIATSPESVLNAPISPTPTTGVAPRDPVAPVPAFTPAETPKTKKSLPLVPLLGALGLLAVAGGGAMFMLNSNQSNEDAVAPVAPPPMRVQRPAPVAATAPVAPGVPANEPRSASPGIAPVTGKAPKAATTGQSSVVTSGRGPSATAGLDPTLALKLKQLWKTGAEAKHQKDYKTARAAWTEALKLKPNHPGFQDSINKLPS